jgi:hypothetical protein
MLLAQTYACGHCDALSFLCFQDAATLLDVKRTGSREQLVMQIGDALRLE